MHRSTPPTDPIRGHNPDHALDALFVNTPLRDYAQRPRVNDFTLPVLGVGYIATYAAHRGFNVGVLDAEALSACRSPTLSPRSTGHGPAGSDSTCWPPPTRSPRPSPRASIPTSR